MTEDQFRDELNKFMGRIDERTKQTGEDVTELKGQVQRVEATVAGLKGGSSGPGAMKVTTIAATVSAVVAGIVAGIKQVMGS